jgi:CDP-glucose 4,6-dehydratase
MPKNTFWKRKSVLVTGATGFLGGWLVRELIERQANIVALVRRKKLESQFSLAGFDKQVTVETGQVWERDILERILDNYSVEVVFHTAMSGGDVAATLAEPVDCFRSTVESTWWLLDALRRSHQSCILIVCSSDKAYGTQKIPYEEGQPLAPHHPQEVAKASQDLMAQSFGRVYGLNVAITRCANYYGPFDFNFSRLIPYVARCAAEGRPPQLRSDGHFIRDFIHIQESAWAHLNLAQQLATNKKLRGEVFNFSYGIRLTVMEIVNRILTVSGTKLTPVIFNTTQHEIPNMWLSSEKARRMLGWEPKLEFEQSLDSTVHWYLDYFRKHPPRIETPIE